MTGRRRETNDCRQRRRILRNIDDTDERQAAAPSLAPIGKRRNGNGAPGGPMKYTDGAAREPGNEGVYGDAGAPAFRRDDWRQP